MSNADAASAEPEPAGLANQLEPDGLIETFLQHPPEQFTAGRLASGSPCFLADLDLATTLEEAPKRIVGTLRRCRPIDFLFRTCLTPNVLFVGTTVSEYALLPRSGSPAELAREAVAELKRRRRGFLIIKDLPVDSPLLSAAENEGSRQLIRELEKAGFLMVTGQALAYMPITGATFDDYLKKFSANRRNNFRRKRKAALPVRRVELRTGDPFFTDANLALLHQLYLNVYDHSDIHFEKLTLAFFTQLFRLENDGIVFLKYDGEHLISFCLCYVRGQFLVDKYRGYLYPQAHDYKLFFNDFFDNVDYCMQHRLSHYIIGWTAPTVKAYLGCEFTYTHHAVYIRNPLVRAVLKPFRRFFEGDRQTLENLQGEEP